MLFFAFVERIWNFFTKLLCWLGNKKTSSPGTIATTMANPSTSVDMVVDALTHDDLLAVYKLDRRHEEEDFWEIDHFLEALRRPDVCSIKVKCIATGDLIGFLIFRELDHSLRILRFCVDRTTGDNRMLIACGLLSAVHAQPHLPKKPFTRILRESYVEGQDFLKQLGFSCVAVQDNWFECPPETGYLFLESRLPLV